MAKFLRYFLLISLGTMTACGGGGTPASGGSHASVVLQSVQVIASNKSFPAGISQQFTASGSYSDGTTKDLTTTAVWSSSNATVATISASGIAKGMSPGAVSITATQSNLSGSLAATVVPAALTSISISLASPSVAAGLTDQVTATGSYSDGSTQNLTNSVAWTIAAPGVASISNSGLITAKANGSTVITATQGSISGTGTVTVGSAALVSIAVNSVSGSVPAGLTDQLTAVGSYSDGSSQTLTNSVSWNVSNATVASISNTGLVTGKKLGSTAVTATLGSLTGTNSLTITSPLLVSISVSPASASVGVGFTDQFTATGSYSDGSTQNLINSVNWTVSNSAFASISGSGLLSALSNGSAVITATSGSISGTAPLTITISLVSIAVTPALPTIAPGTAQQFKATGTFTDGSTQDVTGTVSWSSSDSTKAIIGNSGPTSGLAHAVAAGPSTITASSGSISGSTTLTVSHGKLTSIAVTPAISTIPIGVVEQFTAVGAFNDGTFQDITNTVTWSSSQPALVSITVSGVATARGTGTATITATNGAVSGSTTSVTVSAANIMSIAIQGGDAKIANGTTAKLNAIGTFNDGSTRDVSYLASWTSSAPAFATVVSGGRVQSVSPGQTTMTATLGGQSISVNLTVTNATLVSISITPSISSIAAGTQVPFLATGLFSDSSAQVITTNVTWSSSDMTVATISNGSGTHGIATAIAGGNVTISAIPTFGSPVTGTGQLNVTGASLASIALTPATVVLGPAATLQYMAIGTFSDGTSQNLNTAATWSTSLASVATVTTYGQVTGQSAGIATITASLGGVSATSNVVVDSFALTSIAVTPSTSSLPQQIATGFTAIGTFADGQQVDLTLVAAWTSSNASVATVSNVSGMKGIAMGVAPGKSTISALFAGQVGTAALTVTNVTLQTLAISPASSNISLGNSQKFVATGTFTDGSTMDLSTQVAWTSSNVNVAVIDGVGIATSAGSGTTTVAASLNGVNANAVLTVN